ncbi:mediator complex subunit [Candidozyma auris]|uniref:Mediator of RNA polymerase II transcription subunit 16 n=2 Tax=Candidozyma auris TaxID=498019 RepID=A0A2H0ZNG0_CANAR|nr:hypothetical protein B9J08_003790 [[Candida] auris]QWW21527.1 hypothetical protein CA7LBN_000273 [[Candida] auris]
MPISERNPPLTRSGYLNALSKRSSAISWSKYGFITYAHPDPSSGHNMCLTYLENTNGKDWQLAKATEIALKPSDGGSVAEIDRLKWSNLSTDLAVWDVHGNFYILLAGVGLINDKKEKEMNGSHGPANGSGPSPPPKRDNDGPSYELTSYNHIEMIYRDIVPPQAHTKCVAFEWLNIQKPQIINKPATLTNVDESGYAHYAYGVQQHHPPGPSHPISTKQACLAVRQNGLLNLYYQGEHKVEYHKLAYNLAPDGREGSCTFTKAAIGFNSDKKLVICAYDARSDLILTYVVSIDWGYLVDSAQRQRSDPHYHTPKDGQNQPSLSCSLVHEMRPEPTAFCDNEDDKQFGRPEVVQQTLKSIELFSPSFQQDSCLEILITYECMDPVGSQPYTSAYRYNLEPAMDAVGDLFDSMAAENSNESREGISRLVLQGRINLSKQVQQIETAISESLLLFIYNDGSIDSINRETWEVMQPPEVKIEGKESSNAFPSTIMSLLDCGFQFPTLGPSPNLLAISPNMAAFVHYTDGRLQYKALEQFNSGSNTSLCGIGFAYMHACACYSTTSSDDLLVMLRNELYKVESLVPDSAADLIDLVMTESHKAINFQLNSFGKESVDKLLSNPPLQRLLSLQLVLGELHPTNRAIRDMAWIVLNLRSTSFGIMFSLSSIYRQMSKKKPAEDLLQDSVSRAECIMSLVGNVRWLIDLIVYFNQELLQLSFSRSRPAQSKVTLDNSVVLPVILGKVPRLFLMYSLSSIGKTHEILKKLYKELNESNKLFTPMKEALNRFFTACNSSPLNLGLFESFLRECELYVNKELNNVVSNDRNQSLRLEQQLFCRGFIPEVVKYMAKVLIDRHAATISRDLKLSDLYFYENDWIDVGIARKTLPVPSAMSDDGYNPTIPRLRYSDSEVVDALRKIIINAAPTIPSGGATALGKGYSSKNKIRKCTRCKAVSLVADPTIFDGAGGLGVWTMVFQRTCICGNAWVNCS